MRRPRHPMPYEMWSIKTDPRTGKYILQENGITYHLTLEHTRLLKLYYRRNASDSPRLEKWYSGLDRATKKEIVIEGKKEVSDPYFFADPEYD